MSAVTALIASKLAERGWKLSDLANELATKAPANTLRKLQAVMDGEHCSRRQVDAICGALSITKDERRAAVSADREAWWNAVAEEQRKRFTPHLWIETVPSWYPCLGAFLGAELFKRVEVPEDLLALNDEAEIIRRAGELVAAHYQSKELRVRKEEMTGYLYRREFRLAYRFAPDGACIGLETGRVLVPVTRWRIG